MTGIFKIIGMKHSEQTNMKNLENKTIIITGAAMGLGLAAAKELAARGANFDPGRF